MFQQRRAYWRNLDNAAKMFSAASSPKDTRVFRFYCVLKEKIDGSVLKMALDQTIQKYPVFLSVMRKGLFWHYLEKSDLRPVVREEYKEPCSHLYIRDKKELLFEVTYYKNRINFEVFHALTDGTGATEFLRELVKNYLYLMHEKDGLENVILTEQDLTVKDQEEDGFGRYYNPDERGTRKKKNHAYQIRRESKEYEELQIGETTASVKELLEVILHVMEENVETYMPGFTHLQKAQPITLAHHMGAYFEMFRRDHERLKDISKRMNTCPLGSGALAGTTYPLDREYTAELLGFDGPTLNSMDGVSDRDYLLELLSALSIMMMHLSRFCEEVIIWNSNEYQFVEIDDAYSTGSSIMPQKKNPDIAELVRGKTGRVYGALMSILTTMKGIPLAYDKDMQEDKELTFDAIDTVKGCLALFTGMISTMTFNKEVMEASAKNGFTNATDAADYLVNHGVPFRDAHGIVGKLVLYCIDKKIALDDMSLEEYKEISPVFEEDIYDAISMETCVNKRNTIGAPGPEAMKKVIALHEAYLEEC